MKSRGSYVDAGIMLERWMQGCPDLTDVHLRELLTPIGPWKTGMLFHISLLLYRPRSIIMLTLRMCRQNTRRDAATADDRNLDAAEYEG